MVPKVHMRLLAVNYPITEMLNFWTRISPILSSISCWQMVLYLYGDGGKELGAWSVMGKP